MSKDKLIKFLDKHFIIFFGILIGTLMFLLVYGPSTLNVQYDSWIFNGYLEHDIEQHYAGWTHFRNSKWNLPLGKAENLAYPDGTMISYTDSVPLVSIILKVFRGILPETFQFFGIYILLCFILQAISAGMLTSLFTNNKKYISIAMAIFTLSPIMIERAFRHTALASHFLILFALYLYFKSKQENYVNFKWQFILLNILAITIHPYFMPMTMGIMSANALETIIKKKTYVKTTVFVIINIVITLAVGFLIGAIGGGSSFGETDYGYYPLNLNALINPISLGVTSWSAFLKPRGQVLGNYDGFNYIGLGAIFIGLFLILNYVLKNNFKESLIKLKKCILDNIGLFIVAVIFTLFAISNVITCGGKVIIEIPLPKFIISLCSIFRAGARMFYPVFYLIFLVEIVYILRNFEYKNIIVLLSLLLIIQIVDLSPALREKNEYFSNPIAQGVLNTEIWQKISNADQIYFMLENFKENDLNKRYLSAYAGKYGIKINIDVTNRDRSSYDFKKESDRIYGELLERKNPLGDSCVFITDNNDLFMHAKNNLNEELTTAEEENYRIIFPKALQ